MSLLIQAATTSPSTSAPPQAQSQAELRELIDKAISDAIAGRSQGKSAAERAEETAQITENIRAVIKGVRDANTGFTEQPPPFPGEQIPPQVVDISIAFFLTVAVIAIGVPIARAFARRLDRRTQAITPSSDLAPRIDRLQQSIEAVAIEVERVSENQRYATRVLSEMRGLPAANPMEGWSGTTRELEPEPRASADPRG